MCGLPVDGIIDTIPEATTPVGVTHMFLHEWPHVRQLAERVRARFPEVTIVLGGENATGFWPWIFEQTDAVDACVLGEGEVTVLELAARVARGETLEGVPGIATPAGGKVGESGLTTRLTTRALPEVPQPAWDLFP